MRHVLALLTALALFAGMLPAQNLELPSNVQEALAARENERQKSLKPNIPGGRVIPAFVYGAIYEGRVATIFESSDKLAVKLCNGDLRLSFAKNEVHVLMSRDDSRVAHFQAKFSPRTLYNVQRWSSVHWSSNTLGNLNFGNLHLGNFSQKYLPSDVQACMSQLTYEQFWAALAEAINNTS